MVRTKNQKEIDQLRIGGKKLAAVVQAVALAVKPGLSTADLDQLAEKKIKEAGAKPSFKGFQNFPAATCISVNDELVHSIPSPKKILKIGDNVGIDIGLIFQGLFTDMAVTVPVGRVAKKVNQLIQVTARSLELAIAQVRPGNMTGDIGHAVEEYVSGFGYGIVRSLVGHGVGFAVHEEPRVPNFGQPGTGFKLVPGLVIAIEPMVCLGDGEVVTRGDGWTIATADGSLCAHFEHTVVVTSDGVEILTKV